MTGPGPDPDPEATRASSDLLDASGQLDSTRPMGGAEPSSRGVELRRGDAIGRYLVLDVLGRGGMGVVHAAYDPKLDRKIAIKLVKDEGPRGRREIEQARLQREAQALAKLSHPNVVSVYDVGTWQQSVFVAMELVEGETVARWIERRHRESPPSWREVLAIMIPAGRGLAAAHAAGIVHRDFKPQNVMLSPSLKVTVLDFGIALAGEGSELSRETGSAELASAYSLTATGTVMGTPAYMSPEQLLGRIADAASDQFSYCVTLFEALHGRRPFAGRSVAELTEAVLAGAPATPPEGRVPAWLQRVVLRGLARDPLQRHASMDELLVALERDPGRRRMQVLAGLGGAVGLGALVWASVGREADDPCGSAALAMAEVWGPSARAAAAEAFRRDAKVYSEQALVRVEGSLDRYAAVWVDERRSACEAARQVGTDAARDAGLRTACLDLGLRRVDALVGLLGRADQAMVAKATAAVHDLPSPEDCRDAVGWRRATPVPDEPAQQEPVESLRLRLSDVYAQSSIGRLEEAGAESEAILGESRQLGYPPLLAEALYASGGVHVKAGDYAGALPRLDEALLLARAQGLERLECDLRSPLAFVHTQLTGNLELAEHHTRMQEALAERLGRAPRIQARALVDRARIERKRNRPEASVELLERAVSLYEADDGDASSHVRALGELAWSLGTLDRSDEAARVLARAEALAAATLGADHPVHGDLLVQSARIDAERRRPAAAVDKLARALERFRAVHGEQHPNNGAVLNAMATQLQRLGRGTEAIAAYRQSLAIMERVLGPKSHEVSVVQVNLGELLREEGAAEEALRLHQAAQAVREGLGAAPESRAEPLTAVADDLRALGRCDEAEAQYEAVLALHGEPDASNAYGRTRVLLGQGLCARRAGHAERARERLEQALRLAEEHEARDDDGSSADLTARCRFALATALRASAPERATALARRAQQRWEEAPERHARERQQLARWLAGEDVVPAY